MRRISLVLATLLLLMPKLFCQEWVVPDDRKGKLSTFPFDDNTRKEGEKLYRINCMSCHGTPGKANFANLVPPPGDPATDKIQHNSDGEIFYKVSTGRGPMPSFKSILATNDIWNIISFLRSFNTSYRQEVMPIITSSAYPGAVIKMQLLFNAADTSIVLVTGAEKPGEVIPVTGAEVKLYVHRRFGMLPVDEAKTTDSQGKAVFRLPAGLPGDTAGNIRVSARFTNEDVFGSVSKDTLLRVASPLTPVSLVAERAMWNNVRKAPIWILATYSLGVLIAWGFIILVMLKLRDIYMVGKILTGKQGEQEIRD